MTLFGRIHCWVMARVQAVNAYLAGQRGDYMSMIEYERDSRRYQSNLDRDTILKELL